MIKFEILINKKKIKQKKATLTEIKESILNKINLKIVFPCFVRKTCAWLIGVIDAVEYKNDIDNIEPAPSRDIGDGIKCK